MLKKFFQMLLNNIGYYRIKLDRGWLIESELISFQEANCSRTSKSKIETLLILKNVCSFEPMWKIPSKYFRQLRVLISSLSKTLFETSNLRYGCLFKLKIPFHTAAYRRIAFRMMSWVCTHDIRIYQVWRWWKRYISDVFTM